jgi:hypothetical protein
VGPGSPRAHRRGHSSHAPPAPSAGQRPRAPAQQQAWAHRQTTQPRPHQPWAGRSGHRPPERVSLRPTLARAPSAAEGLCLHRAARVAPLRHGRRRDATSWWCRGVSYRFKSVWANRVPSTQPTRNPPQITGLFTSSGGFKGRKIPIPLRTAPHQPITSARWAINPHNSHPPTRRRQ